MQPRGTVKIEGLEATKAAREKKVAQAVASKRDLTDAELVAVCLQKVCTYSSMLIST